MTTTTGVPMHTSSQKATTWATALARHFRPAGAAARPRSLDRLPQMMTALWELFDDAWTQANTALEQAGVPERIGMERTHNERRYVLTEPDGAQRTLSIVLTLAVIDQQPCGWASILPSTSRAEIQLVPRVERGKVAWQVAASSAKLTAAVVQDLFLSVFADDPAATLRLSPLGGSDLFQNPWN